MSKIRVNGLDHCYKLRGAGPALVFVHGAFVDAPLWQPKVDRFAAHHQVLRYDLRGHGRTGPSW
ncbi:MAG: alpha/beta fold hydrolase [Anaerolineae bacterium]|jgi:pimeloyl-ACP methyl ester carboxylesterase